MPAGLTPEGFVAKTFEEIEAGFVARQRADIDPNLDTSRYELAGQLNGIMAGAIAEVWELAEELHDAMDPDKAVGASQDALYSLTDSLRERARASTVVASVTLQPATTIATGDAQSSVEGNPDAKFVNAVPMVNAGGTMAVVPVLFVARATGPTLANAGKLTIIDTPLAGWDAITNATDAQLGTAIESNASYRVRRLLELYAQGGGTVPGIRADLLRLVTVRAVLVLENVKSVAVGGLPPKSFEAIVRSDEVADDDDIIARSIWVNKAAGMESYGSTLVVVTDSEGDTHEIRFSRPTEREVYVSLQLIVNADYVSAGAHAAAKTALVAAAETPEAIGYLDVGADVYAGRFVAAAMQLGGVLNADVRLSFEPIVDFVAAPVTLPITAREIATIDTSRITITAEAGT